MTELRQLLRRPLVVAPMAGGPSTPALVAAVSNAGALGFLAAGYKTSDAVVAEMAAVRQMTTEPFGVNVFVPGTPSDAPTDLLAYLDSLGDDASALDSALSDPTWDDDAWEAKITALLAEPPAVVSFTFGCPPPEVIAALGERGAVVVVTVTDPREALVARDAGAQALCVQGVEAGAHRGSFRDERADDGPGLLALIREVARVTDLPLIGAGGITRAESLATLVAAGAVAAQCGTAFLRCPESGAHPAYKAALGGGRFTTTAFTRSFSGRSARGLVNQFMIDHRDAPSAYPEINNATRPLRNAAARLNDVDRMSLWAGVGFKDATNQPAAEIVDLLSPSRHHR